MNSVTVWLWTGPIHPATKLNIHIVAVWKEICVWAALSVHPMLIENCALAPFFALQMYQYLKYVNYTIFPSLLL